jgi:hypothetical protein
MRNRQQEKQRGRRCKHIQAPRKFHFRKACWKKQQQQAPGRSGKRRMRKASRRSKGAEDVSTSKLQGNFTSGEHVGRNSSCFVNKNIHTARDTSQAKGK